MKSSLPPPLTTSNSLHREHTLEDNKNEVREAYEGTAPNFNISVFADGTIRIIFYEQLTSMSILCDSPGATTIAQKLLEASTQASDALTQFKEAAAQINDDAREGEGGEDEEDEPKPKLSVMFDDELVEA